MSSKIKQIDFSQVRIKQEKLSPPRPKRVEDIADEVIPKLFTPSPKEPSLEDEPDEKKPVEPIKSSNEILAELFRVFNAKPPESLLNDEILLDKKKRKHKEKKHKKKSKKRNRDSSRGSDSSDEEKTKIKKKKKHKKHKKESGKEENCVKVKEECSSPEKKAISRKPSPIRSNAKVSDISEFSISSEDECNIRIPKEPIVIKKEKGVSPNPIGRKIVIKNLKDSKILEEGVKKRSNDKTDTRNAEQDCSDISLSDEETYKREQQFRGRPRQPYVDRKLEGPQNRFSRSNYRGSRSRENSRRRWRASRSRSRSRSRFWRRSRSRSRSRNRRPDDLQIDKKRLLEIARKNAISMFKNGSLPGTQSLPQDVKNKVLMKMRYGGKSVEELTEFCKKLSNGESLNDLSSLSSNEDSDYDKHGNDKAFHHPFILKDRGPIVMNIKNATPIPPKTAEQAKAILTQYPVSSGQQHRLHENEWIPVPATKPIKIDPPPSAPVAKPALAKNVFEKPLPIERQQPAFVPTIPLPSTPLSVEKIALPPEAATIPPPLPVVPISAPATVTENATTSSTNSDQLPKNIFQPVDVTPIITQRLHAMRKLQQNPNDTNALQMIASAHHGMSVWANSLDTPGKFTGTTGASILTPQELSSGQQAWVKRDQLLSTAPVSGGMGMHLLQKMGWKPGEGLGKTKNGCLQPLLLEVKMDKKGLVTKEEHRIPPLLPPAPKIPPLPSLPQLANNPPLPKIPALAELLPKLPPLPQLSALQLNPIILNPIQLQQLSLQHTRPNRFAAKKRPAPSKPTQIQLNIENKHPVCLLGELCGKRKWGPPSYDLVNEEGPSHRKSFTFNVVVNGMMYQPSVLCKTKKEAKALAAKYCLQQLGILPTS